MLIGLFASAGTAWLDMKLDHISYHGAYGEAEQGIDHHCTVQARVFFAYRGSQVEPRCILIPLYP